MRLIKKLKDTSGVSSLFTAIIVLIIAIMGCVLILSIGSVVGKSAALNSAANEIAKNIAADGEYTSTEESAAQAYLSKNGMKNVTVSCDHSGTMQLDTEFTVKLSYTTSFGIGNVGVVPVTLPGKATARSGIYNK